MHLGLPLPMPTDRRLQIPTRDPLVSQENFWWKVGGQHERLIILSTRQSGARRVEYNNEWGGMTEPHGHWTKVETEAGTPYHVAFHHSGNEGRLARHTLERLEIVSQVYVGTSRESWGVVMYKE